MHYYVAKNTLKKLLWSTLLATAAAAGASAAEETAPDAAVTSALNQISDAAMSDEWAFKRLADLCDKIGPRLSGSPQADAAVEQIAAGPPGGGLTGAMPSPRA